MNCPTRALAAALLISAAGIGPAAASELLRLAGDPGAPLTLTEAKQEVSRYLTENGETKVKVGRAAYDDDGNVEVEVVTLHGLPVRHIVVDAKNGAVADSRSGASWKKGS